MVRALERHPGTVAMGSVPAVERRDCVRLAMSMVWCSRRAAIVAMNQGVRNMGTLKGVRNMGTLNQFVVWNDPRKEKRAERKIGASEMNDRIPGSSYYNPVWYRGYRIFVSDLYETHGYQYDFCHDDYDGAFDAGDNRCGQAHSIEEAEREIDQIEDNK